MVVGLLRLEARGIPTGTSGLEAVAPKANVGATPGVGGPREVPRASTASTLPGGPTSNVLVGAEGAVGPTLPSVRPCKGDAALLPLHSLLRISIPWGRRRPIPGPNVEVGAVGRPLVPRRAAVFPVAARVANATGASDGTLLAVARATVGPLPRPIVGGTRAPSKGGAATALDGPRPTPSGAGAVVGARGDRALEVGSRRTLVLPPRGPIALGAAEVAGASKTIRGTPMSVLPSPVGAEASDGDHL